MNPFILVAGATGNLGGRIVKVLLDRGVEVHAIVRPSTDEAKIAKLEEQGVQVLKVKMDDHAALTQACKGATCVVSVLAGLRETMIDAQTQLLSAAVAAGVPRFIPSDFSSDFTLITKGENRNFDVRAEFRELLNAAPIKATSIFNGCFAEVLQYNMPFLNRKNNTVGFLEDAERKTDFTTMDDTAAFTAAAALDPESPRNLYIASFQVNANEMAEVASEVFGTPFNMIPMGTIEQLSARNKADRAADPEGEKQLYPKWQGSQYFQTMFSVLNDHLDNDRYTGIEWTGVREYLVSFNR